jgi:hypothetical protein
MLRPRYGRLLDDYSDRLFRRYLAFLWGRRSPQRRRSTLSAADRREARLDHTAGSTTPTSRTSSTSSVRTSGPPLAVINPVRIELPVITANRLTYRSQPFAPLNSPGKGAASVRAREPSMSQAPRSTSAPARRLGRTERTGQCLPRYVAPRSRDVRFRRTVQGPRGTTPCHRWGRAL